MLGWLFRNSEPSTVGTFPCPRPSRDLGLGKVSGRRPKDLSPIDAAREATAKKVAKAKSRGRRNSNSKGSFLLARLMAEIPFPTTGWDGAESLEIMGETTNLNWCRISAINSTLGGLAKNSGSLLVNKFPFVSMKGTIFNLYGPLLQCFGTTQVILLEEKWLISWLWEISYSL